jgi:Protein kinase domain
MDQRLFSQLLSRAHHDVEALLNSFLEVPATVHSLKELAEGISNAQQNISLDDEHGKKLSIDKDNFCMLLQMSLGGPFRPKLTSENFYLLFQSVITGNCNLFSTQQVADSINRVRPTWMQRMKASELLKINLLQPRYVKNVDKKLPNQTGSARNVFKQPFEVREWSDFDSKCLNMLCNMDLNYNVRVPRARDRLIENEHSYLHPFILDNLFLFSLPCMTPETLFSGPTPETEGKPDFVIKRNGELLAVIEVKGCWIFRNANILEIYHNDSDSDIVSAIRELYHYMRLNFKQYGILTSYELTLFFKREVVDGRDILFITNGIHFKKENPTIQESFVFFESLLSIDQYRSPPVKPQNDQGRFCENFQEDRFKFNKLLGSGNSKVYLVDYDEDGEQIALKRGDALNQSLKMEFDNEIIAYMVLKDLQGNEIPDLKLAGYIVDELFICLGFSVCGRSIEEKLSDKQKSQIKTSFQKIHDLRVIHNDIKKENMLINDQGDIIIIDFGLAKINATEIEMDIEKMKLEWVLDTL